MKITFKTVLITCVVLLLAVFGGVGAVMMTVLLPKIKEIQAKIPAPTPAQIPVPGMEHAGPPILKVQTTETLTKTAEELDQWSKDLKKKEEKQLERDKSLIDREELMKNERAALNVERDRVLELQTRMDEKLQEHKKEIESRVLSIDKDEDANLQKMADLYALMKVDECVELLRGTPDEQVAKIISLSKIKRQAKLLETWASKHPDDRERILRINETMKRFGKTTP
ncbi:MAG: hypothetical protein V4507_09010 [Verrucomicrobiota bacterium]